MDKAILDGIEKMLASAPGATHQLVDGVKLAAGILREHFAEVDQKRSKNGEKIKRGARLTDHRFTV